MKVLSKLRGGHTPSGKPFFENGETKEFVYRELNRCDREFVDAMIAAKLVDVIEDDPPAKVIPFPQPTPTPEAGPMKVRRARKAKQVG